MGLQLLALAVAATLGFVTGFNAPPGYVHGRVFVGGCGGNAPAGRPDECSYPVAPNQRIVFRSDIGIPMGSATSGDDGSYAMVLPAGHYHIFAPNLSSSYSSEITIYPFASVDQPICLCAQFP
jgi:hypothetical protein